MSVVRRTPRLQKHGLHLRLLIVWLVLLASSVPAIAGAKPSKLFDQHVDQAQRYVGEENYDRAIEEFQAAYQLDREPVLLLSIGRCHFLAGRPKQALDFYQLALKEKLSHDEREDVLASIAKATIKWQEQQQREARESAARQAEEQRRLLQLATRPPAPSPPPVPPEKPVYKKAWFWATLGGIVGAGLTIGLAVGLTTRTQPVEMNPPSSPTDGAMVF